MKRTILLSVFYLLFSTNLVFPQPVHADVSIGPTFGSPFTQVGPLISVILFNAYIIAGVIVLFLLVFGGLGIIIGAGSGDKQRVGQGRQALTAAIIGFLIIFASYWIIQLVEVITGFCILEPLSFSCP